jgi:hypothetical protein
LIESLNELNVQNLSMKLNKIIFSLTIVIAAAIIFNACKKDNYKPVCDGSNLTYNSGISAIISSSCLSSSCHGAGSSNPNFTTYALLHPYLTNGKFKTKVIDEKSMPKTGKLSNDQLNKIECWVENNYPEN